MEKEGRKEAQEKAEEEEEEEEEGRGEKTLTLEVFFLSDFSGLCAKTHLSRHSRQRTKGFHLSARVTRS